MSGVPRWAPLDAADFRSAVERVAARAATTGGLVSLTTRTETLREHGIDFTVRVLERARRKEREMRAQADAGRDPFLDIEPDLFVGDLSRRHRVVLNKYNVVENHALIVTREFESQEAPLDLEDLATVWSVVSCCGGLAFINGGRAAGASLPHKHLQWVPFPLGVTGPTVPLAPLLDRAEPGRVKRLDELPFPHALAGLSDVDAEEASVLRERWSTCLEQVRLENGEAYNMLCTRDWIAAVPRSADRVGAIPVNAMAYAGSLFARDDRGLEEIRALGPMEVLRRAGRSAVVS